MSLEKMLATQEQLDNRIIAARGIVWTDEDRFRNTLVALDVEISEFANEGRWFKVWSDDQEPRTWFPNEKDVCDSCKGEPIFIENKKIVGQCEDCDGCGVHFHNPLLEEYVDAVHFFLSIANQKGWKEHLYLHEEAILELEEKGFDGGINGVYLELKSFIAKMSHDKNEPNFFLTYSKHEFCFRTAWFLFIAIGMIQFGFTFEQIEEAYFAKNKMNHERQDNGY
ncbi:dUTP diphosphatase [Sutcliffiella cohnii]